MKTKVCSSCKVEKPLDQFWKRKDSKDGHRGECKDCLNIYFRKRRQITLERRRQIGRKCYHKHREEYCLANRKRKQLARIEVLTHYGNGKLACVHCGFNDIRALSIDHIAGGGKQHERERRSTQLAQWLRKRGFPLGYQTLCMNCQFIKKLENKEQTKQHEV